MSQKIEINVTEENDELYINVNDLIRSLIYARDSNEGTVRGKVYHDIAGWLHDTLESFELVW